MEKLNSILRSGGTSPQDFTLHDERHSVRVADRMEQLLTDEIRDNLSDCEIALLLLAAYGHDIGMTPERKKVQDHHRHLFGYATDLTEPEKQQFQKFLDEYPDRPITPPLSSSLADLNLADELAAFYVRDRHNEWSADWLREKLVCDSFGNLQNPVEILIRLCSSHHWSHDRLRANDFDPILTNGSQPQLIHLRYLACILRLADILENDPERTPKVLYEHRNIEDRKKSLIHWRKDHAFTVDIRENQLHFHARPPDAHVHKALEELADWIDHELNGIASLGDRLPVHNTVGKGTISRRWHLAPALTRDIRPFDASYEYIEGAFRPDTARLLQLLSNEQLYGNPLVAVRELLQNAFDAVREKIARKRLEPQIENPADRNWEEQLGNLEQVTLTLKPGADGEWLLICEDTGVGLTKALITGHLLVSGHTRRHAIIDLERRCQDKGFRLGRTGQFGIGVLSYFMLADEVHFTTTRYQGCEDGVTSWHFSTRGVGSFGELRQLQSQPFPLGGTRLEWKLRPDRIKNPHSFARNLAEYLKQTIIRIPCRFHFITEGIPVSKPLEWTRPSGWTRTSKDWLKIGRSSWMKPNAVFSRHFMDDDYTDPVSLDERQASKIRHENDTARARKEMRCEIKEVELPGGVARARLILIYFELSQGRSLIRFPEDSKAPKFKIGTECVSSWKGVVCDVKTAEFEGPDEGEIESMDFGIENLSVEVEFDDLANGALSVNRHGVVLPYDDAWDWWHFLDEQGTSWANEVLSSGAGLDYFRAINQSILELPLSLNEGCCWHHRDEGPYVRPLVRPFALTPGGEKSSSQLQTAEGQKVAVISVARCELETLRGIQLNVLTGLRSGAKSQTPCLYWPIFNEKRDLPEIAFPPEWEHVAFVKFSSDPNEIRLNPFELLVVNSSSWFARLVPEKERIYLQEFGLFESEFWRRLRDADTASSAALAFGVAALNLANPTFSTRWTKYQEEKIDHLQHLWHLISSKVGKSTENLQLLAGCGDYDALLKSSETKVADFSKGATSLLPHVTDPRFVIIEVPQTD
jgi:hypothetical protein